MVSQKNNRLKYCIKCGDLLNHANWLAYLRGRSNYICTPCFRAYGKQYSQRILDYNEKQNDKYKLYKSAVIFSYGNACIQCSEDNFNKLTIEDKENDEKPSYRELYDGLIRLDKYYVICYNCSKNANPKDKYALRDKELVIEKYGGSCIDCQEDKLEKLTIKSKKTGLLTGVQLYRWLIKHNYPNDLQLQILCFNCKYDRMGPQPED